MFWRTHRSRLPELRRKIAHRERFSLRNGDPIIQKLDLTPVETVRESHHFLLLRDIHREHWIRPRDGETIFFLPISEKNAHQAFEGRRLGNIVAEEMPDPNP